MLAPTNAQTPALAKIARQGFALVLDMLYPPRCGGCGIAGEGWFCPACSARMQTIPLPMQRHQLTLDYPRDHLSLEVLSPLRYATPISDAIQALKFDGARHTAAPLAKYLVEAWHAHNLSADFIVPIPLHPRRMRERGYNQSEELACCLSMQAGIPIELRALQRARHTRQQSQLEAAERLVNVRGAFTADVFICAGKHIMLLDDVTTTGATLRECCMAMLDAGAAHVSALTLARAE